MGVIGIALNNIFKNAICYDPNIDKYNDASLIVDLDVVFVAVPTPHKKYKGLDMTIVESVIKQFADKSKVFVIVSALQPGTADKLSIKYNQRIVVQPEYFGETINHPLVNLEQNNFLILGGNKKDVREVIKAYQKVYNADIRIRKVTALEAEVIKLSENRAIAYKVDQCQELYDVCQSSGVDYDVIREAVYGDDPRFTLWWTFIYEENRGFNSKCIPKDVYGWQKWVLDNGVDPILTKSLLSYNSNLLEKNNINEK